MPDIRRAQRWFAISQCNAKLAAAVQAILHGTASPKGAFSGAQALHLAQLQNLLPEQAARVLRASELTRHLEAARARSEPEGNLKGSQNELHKLVSEFSATQEKKPYSEPTLIRYGSVEQLTQNAGTPNGAAGEPALPEVNKALEPALVALDRQRFVAALKIVHEGGSEFGEQSLTAFEMRLLVEKTKQFGDIGIVMFDQYGVRKPDWPIDSTAVEAILQRNQPSSIEFYDDAPQRTNVGSSSETATSAQGTQGAQSARRKIFLGFKIEDLQAQEAVRSTQFAKLSPVAVDHLNRVFGEPFTANTPFIDKYSWPRMTLQPELNLHPSILADPDSPQVVSNYLSGIAYKWEAPAKLQNPVETLLRKVDAQMSGTVYRALGDSELIAFSIPLGRAKNLEFLVELRQVPDVNSFSGRSTLVIYRNASGERMERVYQNRQPSNWNAMTDAVAQMQGLGRINMPAPTSQFAGAAKQDKRQVFPGGELVIPQGGGVHGTTLMYFKVIPYVPHKHSLSN